MVVSSVSDPVEVDQEVYRAAEELVRSVRRRVDDEPRVLHAAQEYLDRRVHLQPRQRTAEAGVDAAGPAEVLVVRAFGVECVRVGELARVAVRGAVHEEDRRTLRDDRPSDLDVGESGPAGKEMDRRLEAQDLLDGAGDQTPGGGAAARGTRGSAAWSARSGRSG